MTKEQIIEQIGEKLSPFTGVKPKVIADILLEILNASDPYNDLYVSKTDDENINGVKSFLDGLAATDIAAQNITASTSLGGGSLNVTGNSSVGGDLEVTGNIIGTVDKWNGLSRTAGSLTTPTGLLASAGGGNSGLINLANLKAWLSLADKEDKSLKVTNFSSPNDLDYPTTLAVKNYVSGMYAENNSGTTPTASSLNTDYGTQQNGFRVYYSSLDMVFTKTSTGWIRTDITVVT